MMPATSGDGPLYFQLLLSVATFNRRHHASLQPELWASAAELPDCVSRISGMAAPTPILLADGTDQIGSALTAKQHLSLSVLLPNFKHPFEWRATNLDLACSG
jgi:hypothetical protein